MHGPATAFGTYLSPPSSSLSSSPSSSSLQLLPHDGDNNRPIEPFGPHGVPNPSLGNWCFSTAPLTNITRIRVLESVFGFCQGILFDYENGARRSVGNCRIGVDRMVTYSDPSHMCYVPTKHVRRRKDLNIRPGPQGERQAVRVVGGCSGPSTHDHEDGGWICCSPLRGEVNFWFTSDGSVMSLTAPAAAD